MLKCDKVFLCEDIFIYLWKNNKIMFCLLSCFDKKYLYVNVIIHMNSI